MANYSDYDLRMASQIAYIDGLDASIKAHPEWTLKQHFENNPGFKESFMANDQTLYNEFTSGKYADWKILDINNTNADTGFVGCAIDTGDGNAIVAFRGSESMDGTQIVNDWVIADAGLLNNTETTQQSQAAAYLEKIVKEYPEYDSFSVTGHSLGGNLAEHATVMASDEVYGKIDRTLSLDGPGFSDEYIKEHEKRISKRTGKIDHYQYSLVGAIMNYLPGSTYMCMMSNEEDGLIKKHSLYNIQFDENGNMISAVPDDLAKQVYALTNAIDDNTFGEGVWSLPSLLLVLSNPILRIKFETSIVEYLNRYNQEIRAQMDARSADVDFKVDKACLDSAQSSLSSCQEKLNQYAAELDRIKSNINILIKLAAIYSVGIKLRTSAGNLEKLANYSEKLSSAAGTTLEKYQRYENAITSNANNSGSV